MNLLDYRVTLKLSKENLLILSHFNIFNILCKFYFVKIYKIYKKNLKLTKAQYFNMYARIYFIKNKFKTIKFEAKSLRN